MNFEGYGQGFLMRFTQTGLKMYGNCSQPSSIAPRLTLTRTLCVHQAINANKATLLLLSVQYLRSEKMERRYCR